MDAVSAKGTEFNTTSLEGVSLAEITEVLNRGYEGYSVPIDFTTAALARRIQADHVDLTRSLALLDAAGSLVGCILVAVRGRQVRIAALGIASESRGAGLGRLAVNQAIAQAGEDGNERIVLEVLSENLPARRLYETIGFVAVRTLVGYKLTCLASSPAPIEECDPLAVLGELVVSYPDNVTWQLSPLSFAATRPPLRGFRSPAGAVALVEPTLSGIRLAAIAVPRSKRGKGCGRALMRSLVARLPKENWFVPAVVPETLAASFFLSTGWVRTPVTQVEMELGL
jgi:ribosomal protein S18 acetylase RimI-like enzyme